MSLDDRLSSKGLPAHTVVKISVDNLIKIKQAILADLLEIIGETDIQVRGTTQNKANTIYWTKATKVDYELRQELREKIEAYCD